jgi:Uma2 family endonuclease
MAQVTDKKLMTAEEFFDWCQRPENEARHWELARGEVVEVPRPGERHAVVCANVTRILGNYAFARQQGIVLSNDAGVVLERDPDTVRGPDIMFFDECRDYEELSPKITEGIPQLAVEVLSPSDRPGRILGRISEFLRGGIRLVWFVEPEERTISVHRPDRSPYLLRETDELTGEDVLPDFRCPVAAIFFSPKKWPTAPANPPAPPSN